MMINFYILQLVLMNIRSNRKRKCNRSTHERTHTRILILYYYIFFLVGNYPRTFEHIHTQLAHEYRVLDRTERIDKV